MKKRKQFYTEEIKLTPKQIEHLLAVFDSWHQTASISDAVEGSSSAYKDVIASVERITKQLYKAANNIEKRIERDNRIEEIKKRLNEGFKPRPFKNKPKEPNHGKN